MGRRIESVRSFLPLVFRFFLKESQPHLSVNGSQWFRQGRKRSRHLQIEFTSLDAGGGGGEEDGELSVLSCLRFSVFIEGESAPPIK
jgi:hypothetical protein